MLSRLQFVVEGFFEWSAGAFNRAGLTPNSVTILSFLLAVLASAFYTTGMGSLVLWIATIISLLSTSYLDAIDGAMARRFGRVTKAGGVLDSVLDRIGEVCIYSALALGALVDFRLAVWALSASFMVSYVRARAEVEGVTLKGVGVAERPERLLILLLATIMTIFYPGALTIGAGLIAMLSSVTVLERLYRVSRRLSAVETKTA